MGETGTLRGSYAIGVLPLPAQNINTALSKSTRKSSQHVNEGPLAMAETTLFEAWNQLNHLLHKIIYGFKAHKICTDWRHLLVKKSVNVIKTHAL